MDIDTNIENTLQHLTKLYFDHKYENICNILKIEHNSNHNDDKPTYKYNRNKDEMVFYDNNNPTIFKRVYTDDETKYILNTLVMVTSNSINEKDIIDSVINKWLKNIHQIKILNSNVLNLDENKSRTQIKISKKVWEDLLKACKNKGISSKIGFKMSLINYFNEVCDNMTMS